MLAAAIPLLSRLFMMVKTATLRFKTEQLHLTALDQNAVRVYTQALLIFPFPDHTQADAATAALSAGLREALREFPFLAGTLSLSDPETGKLTLTYPAPAADPERSCLFASKHVPFDTVDFPYTYEQLKSEGMPPRAFKGEIFRPDDLLKYPGIAPNGEGIVDFQRSDAPVMRVQANFIPGGLVLSIYVHHTVMDCAGINTFWKCFAKHVSRSGQRWRGTAIGVLGAPPDQSNLRRKLDARVPALYSGPQPTAEAYIDGTYTYPKTLPEGTPCTFRYFIFSAERLQTFRKELQPHFRKDSPPTIFTVLAALIWIHVTRARATRLGGCGRKQTNIGICTDLRRRMHPQFGESYMGNLALYSKGTMEVGDFLAERKVTKKTIVRVIQEIQRTISKVNNDWAENHMAFMQSIKHIKDTECALGFRFGWDIYITSWLNFGADLQWNIPGTDLNKDSLNGRADFIRRAYLPSDGGIMVMPRRRSKVNGVEAPYEVIVRLAEVDMNALLNEEGGLRDWAQNVIE